MNVLPDLESMSRAAAELVVNHSTKAIEARGRFSLVLAGGGTPRRTYEHLASGQFRSRVNWGKTHIFWGDERCVPPDDQRSNERMAREAMLDHVSVPPDQIVPIRCAGSAQQAADVYETKLKTYFGNRAADFDMILLGLGTDGHTSSLFPGSNALEEKKRWVAVAHSGKEDFERVSLTPVIINRAKLIVFLVAGREKQKILREVTAKETVDHQLPGRLIRPANGQLVWLADKEAAGIA